MKKREFWKELEKNCFSILKSRGFFQNNCDFSRHHSKYWHCIGFQDKSDHTSICVNIGVQLDFMRMPFGVFPKDYIPIADACLIKRRAIGRNGEEWCEYSSSSISEVHRIVIDSLVFFDSSFSTFPGMFETLKPSDIGEFGVDQLPGVTQVGTAHLLACVNKYIGRTKECREFAQYGLNVIATKNRRTNLKSELEVMARM